MEDTMLKIYHCEKDADGSSPFSKQEKQSRYLVPDHCIKHDIIYPLAWVSRIQLGNKSSIKMIG